ncbi:glycosyltransferase family 4 protein [Christiangramia aquimixticola]|uniref:glycosyltransferase family 4 protein n=1 Tax=Christiangramia aquimixticola TaxID=1697558 RepID=UPI003AA96336
MKFGIITYIQHTEFEDQYYSYSPYIREMDLWMQHVGETIVLAPKTNRYPDRSEIPYKCQPDFIKVKPLNFNTFMNAIISFIRLPLIIVNIWEVFNQSDHIHLRCPGNISLLGCIVQILFPKKAKTVKYAGNWDPDSKQPWTYKLQKKILSNRLLSRNLKVLVYGKWKNQTANVIPFFTASFSEKDRKRVSKEFSGTLNFIFVGTLSEGKQPLFAIQLIEYLLDKGIEANLKLYGTGILKEELHNYIANSKFSGAINLKGFIDKNELKSEYLKSHFLILPSKSEGWPKAVAEAMFFGCIPIATSISCVSWMLDHGKRGILIPDNIDSARKIVYEKLRNATKLNDMANLAQEWSQKYTLERFDREITKFL